MSPKPSRPRRRLGPGGISLLVLATSTTLLWSASSGSALAAPTGPQPVCADGTCTITFDSTGAVQTWTVPSYVTSLDATVLGAGGGSSADPSAGGLGGRTKGTIAVKAGDELSLVVGTAGVGSTDPTAGAASTYGGGGAGGDSAWTDGGGASGGGGSFLFDDGLLLAAGGGGGSSALQAGGSGGGAGTAAGAGTDSTPATGGLPGTLASNGAGGDPNGGDGAGAVAGPSALPVGGQGGSSDPETFSEGRQVPGGGGGGGYHAGGGGGVEPADLDTEAAQPGAGGGGGAGYAAKGATEVSGSAGARAGNGQITLSYADVPKQNITFTSSFDSIVVGHKAKRVSAEASGSAAVVFSVDPSTTNEACTVSDKSLVAFAHVGTCVIAVDAAADAQHGPGHNELSFDIAQGNQTLTFPALPSTGQIGDRIPLAATSDSESGSPIVFSLGAGSADGACAIEGTTLRLTGVGRCNVLAAQAGTTDYKAARTLDQDVAVTLIATTTELTFSEKTPVFGQPVTASVVVSGTATSGFVQFSVDSRPFGDRVSVLDGTASIALPTDLGATDHLIEATFTPTDATYADSTVEQTLPVSQARTNTELTVRTNAASVVVGAIAPGAGVPEGTVVFSFGDTVSAPVTLVRGKAAYDGTIPADTVVNAVYSGDDDFAGSSTSTRRRNPVITAKISSDSPRSAAGWYRTPVTVSFTCTEGSGTLTADCPDPVTLSADGASQGVTETVFAEDGGIATASVVGINIDTVKPEVEVLGVEEGDRFFSSAPETGCTATDALSGVRLCSANRKVKDKAVTYSASAIDQAGNVSVVEVHATTYNRGITDAPYVDGAYVVKPGQAVTLVAKSSKRPQVYKPVTVPKKPTKSGDKFTATETDDEWALGYTIPTSLKPGTTYNLGIKTTSKYTIKIKVIS